MALLSILERLASRPVTKKEIEIVIGKKKNIMGIIYIHNYSTKMQITTIKQNQA